MTCEDRFVEGNVLDGGKCFARVKLRDPVHQQKRIPVWQVLQYFSYIIHSGDCILIRFSGLVSHNVDQQCERITALLLRIGLRLGLRCLDNAALKLPDTLEQLVQFTQVSVSTPP